jgi:hypothetical protein
LGFGFVAWFLVGGCGCFWGFGILKGLVGRIRTTKTGSGATAVQVVRYERGKVVLLKHVGSSKDQETILELMRSARIWLEQYTGQTSLLGSDLEKATLFEDAEFLGVTYPFAHEVLVEVARGCGFDVSNNRLLIDLAIMRIIEPVSKARSMTLLQRYFEISHSQRQIYRTLPSLFSRKEDFVKAAARCALDRFKADISLVLYDVTTLYFESFAADELRIPGFSKDNKPSQPQIVIGLLVTRDGFPLEYEIFQGNTFEGKTMLPVLDAFMKTYDVKNPVVVGDAAMLSKTNINELKKEGISYIVGARLGNLPLKMINKIDRHLAREDGATRRFRTTEGDLITSFTSRRYRKHKDDMNKQIERAQEHIAHGRAGKNAKFVEQKGGTPSLNQPLIEKAEKLCGIRGYYTDLPKNRFNDNQIISHYHDLWRVEQAFRMAKSDLAIRPIFHHTQDAIKTHILICFTALAITKYIELTTGATPRQTKDLLWDVTDAKFLQTTTKKTNRYRSKIKPDTQNFINTLKATY